MWLLRPPFGRPDGPVDPAAVMAAFRGRPGVYVHVPFCQTICPFCPYNKIRYDRALVTSYFSALRREVEVYTTASPARAFTSLYVGGGTPTLCLEELAPLLAELRVEGERAVEVHPEHLAPPTLDRLVELGFGHVSLGIQSFDAAALRHLGRVGSKGQGRRALEAARGRFACLDVDLIFDTAFGEPRTFLRDVETCFRAEVDQVSAYPLMRFRLTPFGKARHDPRVEHAVLRRAERIALDCGYVRGSVWTFHRRGGARYSSITRPWYLGLGAGAATFTGRSFLVNHFALDAYAADLASGRLPVARHLELGGWHAAAFRLFWQAYAGSLDPMDHVPSFPEARALTALLTLGTVTGHLRRRGRTLTLTSRGYDAFHDLERWVTYRFIEPLWEALTPEQRQGAAALADRSASCVESRASRATR